MKNILTIILTSLSFSLWGQSLNDECIYATDLGLTSNYCSGNNEFNNFDASASTNPVPFCFFGGADNDIWYSFTPILSGSYISVSGGLAEPSIAVYSGGCGSLTEVGCSSTASGNFVELSLSDLLIGQVYYLRVDGRDGATGSFQLCIKSFAPVRTPESDCKDAVVLCDKSPFVVENLNSTGDVQNELTGPCVNNSLGQNAEQASVWYVWTCDDPGTLEFTLSPNNPNNDEEDLDFVVYEFPGGIGDCDNRIPLRCMLSGETAGLNSSPCYGPTGLSAEANDVQEVAGCQSGDDNFVSPIVMESGKTYGLIVNNFSQSGFGFQIDFGGTGTFLGPEAGLEIEIDVDQQTLECDKSVLFKDLSFSETDPIISYSWNFGAGSTPSTATGNADIEVIYDSFGDKIAAITVETTRGCLVTQPLEFYVAPCCQDTSTLVVTGLASNVDCFGDDNGVLFAEGENGSKEYEFSIDGEDFRRNPRFSNLPAGEYEIYIVDKKGCRDTTTLIIEEPTLTVADAGPDVTVELGETGMIDASIISDYMIDSLVWSPLDSFTDCTNCLDPTVFPPGSTTYTLTVTDENGCTSSDQVQFLVNIVRPVYYPNIITVNGDRNNDFFNIFGGKAVKGIESLKVYDRWGNLMYDGKPALNDHQDGWDGTFNDKEVNPGVYAWIATISFIDKDDTGQNVTLDYAGDVTVLR